MEGWGRCAQGAVEFKFGVVRGPRLPGPGPGVRDLDFLLGVARG